MKKLFEKKQKKCPQCHKRAYHNVIIEGKNSWLKCRKCFQIHSPKVLSVILFLILIFQSGCFSKKTIQEDYTLTFRLKPDTPLNYTIELNNTFVKSGVLDTSWNDIKVKQLAGQYIIYFWDKDHYVDTFKKYVFFQKENQTLNQEIKLNPMNLKGKLSVSLSDTLNKNYSGMPYLTFKANNTIKKLAYCLKRTIGIIYSNPATDNSICENGYWTNITQFGNLTDNFYYCDYMVTSCKKANSQECENNILLMPINLNADKCYFTGKTLKDGELYSIPLNIKTMPYFDINDKIEVWMIDSDLTPKKRILEKEWGYGFNDPVKIGEVT